MCNLCNCIESVTFHARKMRTLLYEIMQNCRRKVGHHPVIYQRISFDEYVLTLPAYRWKVDHQWAKILSPIREFHLTAHRKFTCALGFRINLVSAMVLHELRKTYPRTDEKQTAGKCLFVIHQARKQRIVLEHVPHLSLQKNRSKN